MILHLVKVLVFQAVLLKVLVFRESVEISEDRVPFHLTGIFHPQVVLIGVHRLHFLPDFLFGIREVDAVAERLAHLRLAVGAGKAHAGGVAGKKYFRKHERLAVDGVELLDDVPGLLKHGLLVLAGRDCRGLEGRDVGGLAHGVSQEAYGDAVLEAAHLYFRFQGRVALQPSLTEKVHIVEAQFAERRDLGLDEDVGDLGIYSAGKVIQRHVEDVLPHLLGMFGVVGQRLGVRDHNVYLVIKAGILQFHTAADAAHVMADVQFARRPVTRQDYFFRHIRFFLLCAISQRS